MSDQAVPHDAEWEALHRAAQLERRTETRFVPPNVLGGDLKQTVKTLGLCVGCVGLFFAIVFGAVSLDRLCWFCDAHFTPFNSAEWKRGGMFVNNWPMWERFTAQYPLIGMRRAEVERQLGPSCEDSTTVYVYGLGGSPLDEGHSAEIEFTGDTVSAYRVVPDTEPETPWIRDDSG